MLKIIIFSVALLLPPFATSASEIRFGVQAPRNVLKALKRWKPLADFLQETLHVAVTIIPLKPNNTLDAVKNINVDYVLTNPVLTIILQEKHKMVPLVTMLKPSGKYFAGVIIANIGSGITSATDLKNKRVMGYKFKHSAAAYVFQVKHLLDKGIDPHKDFSLFYEAKKQDNIVLAVRAGTFDAGFIKSGLLESMKDDGIRISDFTIIDIHSDALKNVHSTKHYPEWFVSASKNTSPSERKKVKQALLKLNKNSAASKAARINGFVPALSLTELRITLKALKLPPFSF